MSTDTNTLPGYWLSEASDEFHQLKHFLLMCTPNETIDSMEVWKIDNLEVAGIYERRAVGLLRVSSWVDPGNIEGGAIEDVSRDGFNFNQSGGMIFETGVLQFPQTVKGEFNEKVLLYTEVAVGRPFVYDGNPNVHRVPKGYDSFYIPSKPLDRNNDGEFSLEEYHAAAQFDGRDPAAYNHRYFVQDSQQACPKYIVRCQYTSGRDNERTSPSNSSQTESYEYFDPVDYKPVSVREKMMGQSNARRLITSEQAYRQAIIECEKEDSMLNGKKVWLEKQLTDVDETLRAINLNYATCHENLTIAYKTAVSQLQTLTKQKLDCILSAELELRRQYEQILWGETFITNQTSIGSDRANGPSLDQKVDFLRVWKAHVVHRNAICRFKTVETDVLQSMKPDIAVDASFKVVKVEDRHDASDGMLNQDAGRESAAPPTRVKRSITVDGEPIETSDNGTSQRPAVSFVEHANKIGLFDHAVLSAEDLVASSAKQLIDVSSIKLREAVAEVTGDSSSKFPLPSSFTAPFASGMVYPVPGSFDVNGSDKHDGKQQFESIFKKSIGQPDIPLIPNDTVENYPHKSTSPSLFGDKPNNGAGLPQARDTGKIDTAENRNGPADIQKKSRVYHTSSSPTEDIYRSLGPMAQSARSMKNMSVPTQKKDNGQSAVSLEMSMDALEESAAMHSQFAVRTISERKQRQLGSAVKSISPSDIFCDSVVLSKDDARDIYFTLPFFTKPPVCKLLFSTAMHRRSLDAIYKSCAHSPSAVVILIRSSHFCFGAYLSHPLIPSSSWVGSPACFLFSSTLNTRLPYHGRRLSDQSSGSTAPKAFFVDHEYIEIGNGDLFIDQTLSAGKSEIEGCYGVGFSIGSPEARCFLAGQTEFIIDDLEVWSV